MAARARAPAEAKRSVARVAPGRVQLAVLDEALGLKASGVWPERGLVLQDSPGVAEMSGCYAIQFRRGTRTIRLRIQWTQRECGSPCTRLRRSASAASLPRRVRTTSHVW